MKHTRDFYAGRTEYRESDYKFARTCANFYPPRIDRGVRAGRIALALAVVVLVLTAMLVQW